jgi:hypothetical protein
LRKGIEREVGRPKRSCVINTLIGKSSPTKLNLFRDRIYLLHMPDRWYLDAIGSLSYIGRRDA